MVLGILVILIMCINLLYENVISKREGGRKGGLGYID